VGEWPLPRTKRRVTSPRLCALGDVCRAHNLRMVACPDPDDAAFVERVREIQMDLVIVASYSRILRRPLVEAPAMGCLNVHASLPKYRDPHLSTRRPRKAST